MANLKPRRKRRVDTSEYKPGPTDSEKAVSHCRAQAAYYARAAEKALKRRWDPPKPIKAIQDIPRRVRAPTPVDGRLLSDLASGPIDFFDSRGASTSAELVDVLPKPAADTSEIPARSQDEDEQLAAEALVSMARARGGSESLVLVTAGPTPTSIMDTVHQLNLGPLSAPTPSETCRWVHTNFDFWGQHLLPRCYVRANQSFLFSHYRFWSHSIQL
ncbi:hypothetical protein C8F04DRAFT_1254412 [Mycena alexandri]|uniref:Uncharacterized protein n=1 Tax=Mycena alexandri TaxID=1745969 RepID=A0AAD6X948_9AGAR|nr:hypothetical protein C8F04DRAFT_1254412 [Mycena alexandri]